MLEVLLVTYYLNPWGHVTPGPQWSIGIREERGTTLSPERAMCERFRDYKTATDTIPPSPYVGVIFQCEYRALKSGDR